MFITISRIKKFFINPIGGIMFLNQYVKALILKYRKINKVIIGFDDNFSLVDNTRFFECLNKNIEIFDQIDVFKTKIDIDNIHWNYDYLNKIEIRNGYYFNLREWIIKNSFKNFDIKNIWELSRGYYLKDLALVFLQTKDERYIKQYMSLINSWVDQNPYLYSSNWTNPMEVSIRAINWILSLQIFNKNSDLFEQEFLLKYYTNLYQSFQFLINNIENYPIKSNHYLIDNLGIFILSLSLKNIDKKWIKISFNNLLNTLFSQFDSEGVDFENSSNYHLLKLEALMIAFSLYKQNMNKLDKIIKIKNEHLEQLHKIYSFGIYMFKNDQDTFLFGDNDETKIYDVKPLKDKLIALYKLIFNEQIESNISKIFFKSGYSFLKNDMMNMCFLRKNLRYSSHFHNDILSFQLNYKKQDFFIDPNTFNYNLNREKRYYYLSTQRHNTCFINHIEQSKISLLDPFLRYRQKKVIIKKWNSSFDRDEISLELKYSNFTHLRSLVFNKEYNKLSIFDTFNGKINDIEWNFYLPLSVNIRNDLKAKNVLILENMGNILILEIPEFLKIQIQNAYISKSYNQEEIGKNIKLSYENKQKLSNLSFQITIKENYLN